MRGNKYVLVVSVLFFSGIGGFLSMQAIRIITLEHLLLMLNRENQTLRARLQTQESFIQKYLDSQTSFDLFTHQMELHKGKKREQPE